MMKLSQQFQNFQNFLLKLNNNVSFELNASWITKTKPGFNYCAANKPVQK